MDLKEREKTARGEVLRLRTNSQHLLAPDSFAGAPYLSIDPTASVSCRSALPATVPPPPVTLCPYAVLDHAAALRLTHKEIASVGGDMIKTEGIMHVAYHVHVQRSRFAWLP